jgi:hypothetical protein
MLSTVGYEFDSKIYFAAEDNFARGMLGRHSWLDRVMLELIDMVERGQKDSKLRSKF